MALFGKKESLFTPERLRQPVIDTQVIETSDDGAHMFESIFENYPSHRFTIEEKIGEGSYGAVSRAFDAKRQ